VKYTRCTVSADFDHLWTPLKSFRDFFLRMQPPPAHDAA